MEQIIKIHHTSLILKQLSSLILVNESIHLNMGGLLMAPIRFFQTQEEEQFLGWTIS